jgi:hypothetical protein
MMQPLKKDQQVKSAITDNTGCIPGSGTGYLAPSGMASGLVSGI